MPAFANSTDPDQLASSQLIWMVWIFNTSRHLRHMEPVGIVMYMYLYGLPFMDYPCTLGAAVCHQALPCLLFTPPRARWVWAIGILMAWKLSQPEWDLNPQYPTWKSSVLTTGPPSLHALDLHCLSLNRWICINNLFTEPPQWGSSNEYPQSMFWAGIRKIMYTPVNPSLLYKSGV